MSDEMYQKLAQTVIDGEPEDAEALAKQALEQGLDPLTCINEGLTKGIQKVGELFASGEYYLPELIIGAEAMKRALAVLEPAMVGDQSREVVGRVVLGTVEGDMHEIGKTLVGTMLIANGFQVFDIGVDKNAGEFVAAVQENNRRGAREQCRYRWRISPFDDDYAAAEKADRSFRGSKSQG
jgi:methanogenic corrinoid protein MtbC1